MSKKQDRFLWAMKAHRKGGNLAGRWGILKGLEREYVRFLVSENRWPVSTAVDMVLFFGVPRGWSR